MIESRLLHQHMNIKSIFKRGGRNGYQSRRSQVISPKHEVVLPPCLFDSDASNGCLSNSKYIHLQDTIPLMLCESPHLHQTKEVEILVLIFFWVHGGQHYKEPKHCYLQNLYDLSYRNKTLLNGLCGRNVYTCTHQYAHVNECDHDV